MKNVVDILRSKILGKNKLETLENIIAGLLLTFSVLLSLSIGLSALYPKGLVTIVSMISSFFIFIFTISLVIIWLIKEV
ncbi:MAG: hypothetical protein QXW01_01155 [Candidatus Aenigmatarchaeota archaeon]